MIFANHAPMSSHYSNKIASIVCYWQIIAGKFYKNPLSALRAINYRILKMPQW